MEWPWLDWDWLFTERKLIVTDPGPLAKGIREARLRRNDDLDLRLDLECDVFEGVVPDRGTAGEFVRYEDTPPVRVAWEHRDGLIFGAAQTSFGGPTGKAVAHRIELRRSDDKTDWSTYWLVNVDCDSWPTSTIRDIDRSITRERAGLRTRRNTSGNRINSSDHVFLESGEFRFAFGEANVDPKEVPKEWKAGFLEFEGGDHPLPTEDQAHTIIEFVRFLTGAEISCIGRTDYASDDTWIATASHGRSLQIGHFSDVPMTQPPLPLTRGPGEPELLKYLTQLLPLYRAGRDQDNYFLALYYFDVARRMPPSLDVAKFGTALDLLTQGYFDRHPEKAVLLEKDDFVRRTSEARRILEAALVDVGERDRMLRKFDGINRRSENERREQVFGKLDLKLSAAEEAALRFRNPATHGHKNPDDWVKVIRHGQVLQCLTVRLFLRLLGYDGKYVDYSTVGWPARHLSEPCSPNAK